MKALVSIYLIECQSKEEKYIFFSNGELLSEFKSEYFLSKNCLCNFPIN